MVVWQTVPFLNEGVRSSEILTGDGGGYAVDTCSNVMKNCMHGGRLSVGLDLFLSVVRGLPKPRFNRIIDDWAGRAIGVFAPSSNVLES